MAELDPRLTQLEQDKLAQQTSYDTAYNDLIEQRKQLTEQQKGIIDTWGIQQESLQKQQTQLTLDQIEQQKQYTTQDYTKEQTGAYADYTKQVGTYGVAAEQMASQGLAGSGYSESSKVSMYNAYQNRVAVARDSYTRAITAYDMGIKEAQLSYNTKLAEISYQTLQQQLNLALADFDYKNTAVQNRINYLTQLDTSFWGRKQDVQGQINYEQQQAEARRQWEAEQAYRRQQDAIAQANWEKEFALAKSKAYYSGGGGGGGGTKNTEESPKLNDASFTNVGEGENIYTHNTLGGTWRVVGGKHPTYQPVDQATRDIYNKYFG